MDMEQFRSMFEQMLKENIAREVLANVAEDAVDMGKPVTKEEMDKAVTDGEKDKNVEGEKDKTVEGEKDKTEEEKDKTVTDGEKEKNVEGEKDRTAEGEKDKTENVTENVDRTDKEEKDDTDKNGKLEVQADFKYEDIR